ncbi:MAG: hypothetical protein LBT57_02770 [Puniceicoccales bacterium]|jgi:hypothetical protein|nr:hypothetical protein [Puniceicoccales bacterium]
MKEPKNFQNTSEHLRRAQLPIREILQRWASSHETVQASLACVWELFFDILQQQEEISLADLNTASGIIQKLSACHSQLAALEAKKHEDSVGDEASEHLSPQLSPEILEAIERQLQLL